LFMNDRGPDNLSFWDHLEEVRRRFVWMLLAWVVGSAVSFPLSDSAVTYISGPVGRLVFLSPSEALVVRLKLSILLGGVMAFPVWIYHVLRFVWGAATEREQRGVFYTCGCVAVMLVAGWVFADRILVPVSFAFLSGFGGEPFQPMITAQNYLAFYLGLVVFCCLLFNIPCVILGLARLGIVSEHGLSQYRRHMCVVCFVVSAVLTPPDAVTQIMMAVPIYLLYELSLLGVRIFRKGSRS